MKINVAYQAEDLNYTFTLALETYNKIIEEVTSEGMSVLDPEISTDWDYIRSAFFASTVLTTIGKLPFIFPVHGSYAIIMIT